MIFPEMINLFRKSINLGSSQPQDRTQVSCSAGRRFNLWATREAPFTFTIIILTYYNEMEHNDHVLRVVVENKTICKCIYFKIFLTIRLENFFVLNN